MDMKEQRDKLFDSLKRYHDEAESEHYKGDGCWCDDLLRDIEAQIAGESELNTSMLGHDATRDFIEDFHQENGNYECICIDCKNHFYGRKGRVICKTCTKPSPRVQVIRQAKRLIEAMNLPNGGGICWDESGLWTACTGEPILAGDRGWLPDEGDEMWALPATAFGSWSSEPIFITRETPETEEV